MTETVPFFERSRPLIVAVLVIALLWALTGIMGACAPRPQPFSPVAPVSTPVLIPSPAPIVDAGVAPVLDAVDAGRLPAPVLSHPPTIRLRGRGTNLSGGEFGANVPGKYGVDYKYPSAADVDFFVARGMNYFRIGFRHQRLQPALKGPIDETEWSRLMELVTYARSKGATVAIVPHDSARFAGKVVTEAEFADFWGRVATKLKATDGIALNLSNEPHDIKTEDWVALANAAIREIRRVGFKGVVQVPGNAWTGASHWGETWYGTPNAKAMLGVVDPAANTVFEVHLYLDSDASGGGKDCVSPTIGVERLAAFTTWLRANGKLAALGEIGAPNTTTCKQALVGALELIEKDYDIWTSWAWWSSGVWSFSSIDTYQLSIGPTKPGPQLAWLTPFLACPRPAL